MPKMSNKMYDILKWIAMFFLPALAILIQTVFDIWDITYGDQIARTIVAINAFIGACLGISSISYSKSNGEDEYDPD